MTIDFEIIVGTYEQFLLGYKIQNVDNIYNLERSFATHSHLASIRSVASGKHYLASAGADDSIFLYDMRYRVESGRLMHHTGTVNCVAFTPQASHLLTASNDGSIGIVRCGNWQLEKHWTAPHKGHAVNALAVHPTGKLAMSAGGDGVLRTWNLVKGRQAYATNLVPRLRHDAKNVTIIRWSPDGEKYLFVSNCKIDVYSVSTAGLCAEISLSSRVVCVEFITNDEIVIGHEDGKIRIYDVVADADSAVIEAHNMRVKCLAHRDNYVVSASSAGEIKLWHYGKKKLNMLSRASCSARITSMTLTEPCPDLTTKKVEPKIEDQVEIKKKNIFRMRQEVIVEDEGDDDNVTNVSRRRNKGKKKLGTNKRTAESTPEVEEIIEATRTMKTKKIKKQKVSGPEVSGVEQPKTKKRSLSAVKTVDSPEKRKKTDVVEINDEPSIPKSQSGKFHVDEVSVVKKKKNKSTKSMAGCIEKPIKPTTNKKRKQQNVISNTSGFPTKTKKKKLSS